VFFVLVAAAIASGTMAGITTVKVELANRVATAPSL
jgi:hypothetical protein